LADFERPGKGIFYGHLVFLSQLGILRSQFVYFCAFGTFFGMLHQEKSGNHGA
jgi:hypothetical protein